MTRSLPKAENKAWPLHNLYITAIGSNDKWRARLHVRNLSFVDLTTSEPRHDEGLASRSKFELVDLTTPEPRHDEGSSNISSPPSRGFPNRTRDEPGRQRASNASQSGVIEHTRTARPEFISSRVILNTLQPPIAIRLKLRGPLMAPCYGYACQVLNLGRMGAA
jgi:hypothetical protein